MPRAPRIEFEEAGYNARGEVTGASKHLPDDIAITGFGIGYAYDGIGNRSSATIDMGAGDPPRRTNYEANALNQYTTVLQPAAFPVVGRAPADVAVTVEGEPVARQGAYWHAAISGDDASHGAAWRGVSIEAVDPGGAADGSDLETLRTGHRYVPPLVTTPTYDADGNLLADGRWSYTWNGENRLIAVESGLAALLAGAPKERYRFDYDGMGRRIRKRVDGWDADTQAWVAESEERYVHDGRNVAAVVDAAGNVLRRYAWGYDLDGLRSGVGGSGNAQGAGGVGGLLAARDEGLGRSWAYAYDGNGNVSAVVDVDSGETAHYDYGPFGRTLAVWGDRELAQGNEYRFSTKPVDGTGLVYYGFRHYQPETGRWLSRDPIEERGGANLYAFVGNDGMNELDYLGRYKLTFNPFNFLLSDQNKSDNRMNFDIAMTAASTTRIAAEDVISRMKSIAKETTYAPCPTAYRKLIAGLFTVVETMETIERWRDGETHFVVSFSQLDKWFQPGVNAFVYPGNPLQDNQIPIIGGKSIYITSRVADPGTYLHELSHLTYIVPHDKVGGDLTIRESVTSGHFYDQLVQPVTKRKHKGVMENQLIINAVGK